MEADVKNKVAHSLSIASEIDKLIMEQRNAARNIEDFKRKFADEMMINGTAMKQSLAETPQVVVHKVSWKMRLTNFWKRLKITFGK